MSLPNPLRPRLASPRLASPLAGRAEFSETASRRSVGRSLIVGALAAAPLLAGCTTTTVRPDSGRQVKTTTADTQVQPTPRPQARPGTPAMPPPPLDPSMTDPSAVRLDEIRGQILLYYAVHRKLPPRLEDLASFADLGTEASYVSPTTGKPYTYLPAGLVTPGQTRRLIVYDAQPPAGATRWGILMGEPQGDQPAATWAVPLSDAVFKAYVPAEGVAPAEPASDGALGR